MERLFSSVSGNTIWFVSVTNVKADRYEFSLPPPF